MTARSVSGSEPMIWPLAGATIGQGDLDLIGTLDDVVVGENVAIVADDDARTKTGALLRDVILELVAEEETEARVIHERVRLVPSPRCW